jgi:hypothetical protein
VNPLHENEFLKEGSNFIRNFNFFFYVNIVKALFKFEGIDEDT